MDRLLNFIFPYRARALRAEADYAAVMDEWVTALERRVGVIS